MTYVDIFEIGQPLCCSKCKFLRVSDHKCSRLSNMDIPDDILKESKRLKECPIKELPQKEVCNYYDFTTFTNGHAKGWNDCIDHLTGGGTVQ